MENVTIKLNGRAVSAPVGSTILEAAHLAGIKIPTLCFLKEINEIGACRICVVEVKVQRLWLHPVYIQSVMGWRYGRIHRKCWRQEGRLCS